MRLHGRSVSLLAAKSNVYWDWPLILRIIGVPREEVLLIMKKFLERSLKIFSKLRRRLPSIRWALLLAVTTMFFLSAGCIIPFKIPLITPPSPTPPQGLDLPPLLGGSPTVSPVVPPPPPKGAVHVVNIAVGPTGGPAYIFVDSMSHTSTTTIKKGTTVKWVNPANGVMHTVTADKNSFTSDADLEPGQSFSVTFNQVGPFNYQCVIHSGQTGKIVVTA
jgi:hypothetical protein